MFIRLNRGFVIWGLVCVLYGGFSLYYGRDAHGLMIDPENVKGIAVYGESSDFGQDVLLNQIVFNVTDSSVIKSMISAIEFSTERDCSTLGSFSNAFVYIKFNDDSIEIYNLFGIWSHISKVGMRGSCYFISEEGQTLFETNTQ